MTLLCLAIPPSIPTNIIEDGSLAYLSRLFKYLFPPLSESIRVNLRFFLPLMMDTCAIILSRTPPSQPCYTNRIKFTILAFSLFLQYYMVFISYSSSIKSPSLRPERMPLWSPLNSLMIPFRLFSDTKIYLMVLSRESIVLSPVSLLVDLIILYSTTFFFIPLVGSEGYSRRLSRRYESHCLH